MVRRFRPLTYDLVAVNRKTKHGMSRTYFYRVWQSMKARCFKDNHPHYKNYGGRGIIVCTQWLTFENFRDDMFEKYMSHIKEFGEKETSIDRINNDGDYSPDNCRWTTRQVQMDNQRKRDYSNSKIALCKVHGIKIKTVYGRMKKGWDFQTALTTPTRPKRKSKEKIQRT